MIMLAALRPEAVRETQEVFLVDGAKHRYDCALENLVLHGGDAQRPLPPVRLGYVLAPTGLRPVRAPVDSRVQILEIALQIGLVILLRHTVHAGRRLSLEGEKR
jgi:hypothetical protein